MGHEPRPTDPDAPGEFAQALTRVAVRDAAPADAPALAALAGQLGHAVGLPELRERLAALAPLADHRVVVAERGGAVVGWLAAERRLHLLAGRRVEVVALIVSDAHRREGIGRALVMEAERWRAASGAPTLLVRSDVTRAASHPFYERLGFTRTKTQHAYARSADTP